MTYKGPVIRRFRLPGGREIVSLRPDVYERALARANEALARSWVDEDPYFCGPGIAKRCDDLVDKARGRPIIPNATTLAAMNEPIEGRKRYTDIDELMRVLARPGWLVWARRLLGRG